MSVGIGESTQTPVWLSIVFPGGYTFASLWCHSYASARAPAWAATIQCVTPRVRVGAGANGTLMFDGVPPVATRMFVAARYVGGGSAPPFRRAPPFPGGGWGPGGW